MAKVHYDEMREPLYWIGLCNGGISVRTFTHERGCSIKSEDGSTRFVTKAKLNLDNITKQGGEYKYTMYSHAPISVEGFLKLCLKDQEELLKLKKKEMQGIEAYIELIKQNIDNPKYIGQASVKPTKVYTVISVWMYNTGENGMNFLGTFTDKEKALECFEQAKRDARTDFNNKEVNFKEVFHDFGNCMEFQIYEEDNFSLNRIGVTLKEEPIK